MSSFDWTIYDGDDPTPVLAALGMTPLDDSAYNGQHVLLLVDRGSDDAPDEAAKQMPDALEDTRRYMLLIGSNGRNQHGEDRWAVVGWCWTHDSYTARDLLPSGPHIVGYRNLLDGQQAT